MTNPAFEYRDENGARLTTEPLVCSDGTRYVRLTVTECCDASVEIDVKRLEEVIAGQRDTARQTGPQTTCGLACPKPGHSHICQRSPGHLDVHRDVKQKGDESCRWATPHTPTLAEALDIVRRWYVDVNDGAGWDACDLISDLEKAGYPLPDDEVGEEP